ncbi:hypothetical protein [Polyangium sp. 15x6]|uniref:hypothetical protein n=1 Tax=Polyangium sp. 15x6 TaxID=3042687 RepID=UPI00249B197F|nr:hypothetical protein [Polyangium sp. 15x6]MDI3285160.1 hypothetical protein [Polyangium sp. 15x6]
MAAQIDKGRMERFYESVKAKTKDQVNRLKNRIAAADATSKQVGLEVLAALEIAGVAYTFGFIRGYYGEKKLLKVPVELWATVAFHGVGLYLDFKASPTKEGDFDRILARQLHNLGNGAAAAYAHTLGASMGAEMRQEKSQSQSQQLVSQPVAAGMLPSVGGPALPAGRAHEPYINEPVTQAELMGMAGQV